MPDIPIPDKCDGCATQCNLRNRLAALFLAKFTAEHIGGELMGEDFDNAISVLVPEEHLEEVKEGLRQSAGESLEQLDEQIGATKTRMSNLSETCSGRFKMRAARHGVMYSAIVCTSPLLYHGYNGEQLHLPSHITAEIVD